MTGRGWRAAAAAGAVSATVAAVATTGAGAAAAVAADAPDAPAGAQTIGVTVPDTGLNGPDEFTMTLAGGLSVRPAPADPGLVRYALAAGAVHVHDSRPYGAPSSFAAARSDGGPVAADPFAYGSAERFGFDVPAGWAGMLTLTALG